MSNWKKFKLGDLVTFQRGHDLPQTEFKGGEYPIWGSNGIIGYHNKYTTEGNGIVIGRSGNIGKPQFCKENFWAHNTTLYVKEFHNSNPKFIYYLLQTIDLENYGSGSAVPTLNRNFIHPIEIQAPDLATQTRIAETLSTYDDKIELNRRMNRTLESMCEAVFKEWIIDEGKKKVEKGEWKMGKLGDFVSVQNGYAFNADKFIANGEVKIIKIKNISGNVVDIQNTQFIDFKEVEKLDEKFKIKTGAILIAMTGAEVGKVGIVEKNTEQIWLNQRVGMFYEKVKYGNYFAFTLLKQNQYQEILRNTASGSAQPNISSTQIGDIEIIIPSNEVLVKFGEIVTPLYEKILSNLQQNKLLSQYRDALLPKLMSGKIEV